MRQFQNAFSIDEKTQTVARHSLSISYDPKVVVSDQNTVDKAYEFAPSQFKGMVVVDKEGGGWKRIAKHFVLYPRKNSQP